MIFFNSAKFSFHKSNCQEKVSLFLRVTNIIENLKLTHFFFIKWALTLHDWLPYDSLDNLSYKYQRICVDYSHSVVETEFPGHLSIF